MGGCPPWGQVARSSIPNPCPWDPRAVPSSSRLYRDERVLDSRIRSRPFSLLNRGQTRLCRLIPAGCRVPLVSILRPGKAKASIGEILLPKSDHLARFSRWHRFVPPGAASRMGLHRIEGSPKAPEHERLLPVPCSLFPVPYSLSFPTGALLLPNPPARRPARPSPRSFHPGAGGPPCRRCRQRCGDS